MTKCKSHEVTTTYVVYGMNSRDEFKTCKEAQAKYSDLSGGSKGLYKRISTTTKLVTTELIKESK